MKTFLRRPSIAAIILATTLSGAFLAGRVTADQPHMQAALDALKTARAELNSATADKGGHREKALRLVNDAIRQVEQGVRFDRRH